MSSHSGGSYHSLCSFSCSNAPLSEQDEEGDWEDELPLPHFSAVPAAPSSHTGSVELVKGTVLLSIELEACHLNTLIHRVKGSSFSFADPSLKVLMENLVEVMSLLEPL
ncbi:hypothetical protein AX15_006524 [Amanita polypyramis BW_CC]|nr:hypothetical protein AX15_006524 [Amanita polypyramis BW_CC]